MKKDNNITNIEYNPNITEPKSYNLNQHKLNSLNYQEINNQDIVSKSIETNNEIVINNIQETRSTKIKQNKLTKKLDERYMEKLKNLRTNLIQ